LGNDLGNSRSWNSIVRYEIIASQGGDDAGGSKQGYLGPKSSGRSHGISHENGQIIDGGGRHEPEEGS